MLARRGITDVSNHREADWNPVWSRDDKWIAFESFRGGRRGVYRLFPDTARVFPVATAGEYDCWAPAWSPDSDWLAYVSMASGRPQIHLFNIEANEDHPLTNQPGYALAPAWRPKVKP
jgi:Tol biopolymer transport system component